jgi:hypothetical protein
MFIYQRVQYIITIAPKKTRKVFQDVSSTMFSSIISSFPTVLSIAGVAIWIYMDLFENRVPQIPVINNLILYQHFQKNWTYLIIRQTQQWRIRHNTWNEPFSIFLGIRHHLQDSQNFIQFPHVPMTFPSPAPRRLVILQQVAHSAAPAGLRHIAWRIHLVKPTRSGHGSL